MKLNVLRSDLLHALESAAKFGRYRNGVAYHSQVIFELGDSHVTTRIQIVTFSLCSRKVTCAHSVLAKLTSMDGPTVGMVDPEALLLAVKGCESEVLSIEVTSENTVRVEGGPFSVVIPTESGGERIEMIDVEPTHRVLIDVASFREALRISKYNLSDDDHDPWRSVRDMFLRIGNDVIRVFSTDGRRGAHVPIYRADIPDGLHGIDVPVARRLVLALLQHLERKRGKRGKRGDGQESGSNRVELLIDTDKETAALRHETESVSVYASFGLKGDECLDLTEITRNDYKHVIKVYCAPFIDALQALIKAAQWRSTEECKRGLDMTFDDDGLRLTIDKVNVSCASSTRIVKGGKGLKVRINPKYLLEGIKALKETGDTTILMCVEDQYEGVVLTQEGAGPLMDRTFIIVMPMVPR
jgi:DNA polymerase III sliding clamp (beta) subunit (PCNA family)